MRPTLALALLVATTTAHAGSAPRELPAQQLQAMTAQLGQPPDDVAYGLYGYVLRRPVTFAWAKDALYLFGDLKDLHPIAEFRCADIVHASRAGHYPHMLNVDLIILAQRQRVMFDVRYPGAEPIIRRLEACGGAK